MLKTQIHVIRLAQL